jgi:hypothetical protein
MTLHSMRFGEVILGFGGGVFIQNGRDFIEFSECLI